MSTKKHVKKLISMEVINYQGGRSPFFNDLNSWVKEVREFALEEKENRGWLENISKSNFSIIENKNKFLETFNDIIKNHTNLFFKSKFFNGLNAFVYLPIININSPLIVYNKNTWKNFQYDFKKIKEKGIELEGMIDLENSKVHGVFEEIENTVLIGTDFFFDKTFSSEEIVSILLHEIGHIFSFFEHLPDIVSTNMAIQSAVRNWENNPKEIKIKLLEDLKESFDIVGSEKNQIEEIAETSSSEIVTTVLLKNYLDSKYRSTNNSKSYDISSIEFLADQFVVRHGAGNLIGSLVNKYYKKYNYNQTSANKYIFLIFEILKNIFVLTFNPIVFVLLALFLDPDFVLEVSPKDRLIRIRNDQIEIIKNSDLTIDQKKFLNNQIDEMNELIKNIKDNEGLINKIAILINSRKRNQRIEKNFQKELESLINNPLYVDSSRFSTI